MIRHTYDTPNGPAYYWTPTPEEVRADVASSLSHMKDGWDLKEQAGRMTHLNWLYDMDHRDMPGHPHRGTYTGLVVGFEDTFAPVETHDSSTFDPVED